MGERSLPPSMISILLDKILESRGVGGVIWGRFPAKLLPVSNHLKEPYITMV